MYKLLVANIKQLTRNRQALFWTMVFPLLFVFIFGAFFGSDTMNVGTITLVNESDSELAQTIENTFRESDAFKLEEVSSLDEGKDLLARNQAVAVLQIPPKFGTLESDDPRELQFVTDPGSAQSASIVSSVLSSILNQATLEMQSASPLFSINQQSASANKVTYFDFILAGLIGLSLMNSAVQGIAISIAKYRDEKILKRIMSTPLPAWKFTIAEIISRMLLNFVQISIILAVGIYVFNANIYGNFAMIYLIALLASVLFLTMGFVVAAFAKTTEAAEGMATAVTVPMMFLGGVFFPIDLLPQWLFNIVSFVPLAPLLQMLRGVMLEGASIVSEPRNLILVAAWIVALLLLAIWRFRFTEE